MHMDITPYIERLRHDLLAAAEAAAPEVRAAAERLTYAVDPSARLVLMEAISQAAAEITAELPAGGVDVRLSGRDLEFVVQVAPQPMPTAAPAAEEDEEDDGTIARFSLRIPESLKAKAEEAADRSGHSLNTWLVNLIRAATREGGIKVDVDLSSLPQMINDAMAGFDPVRGTTKHPGNRRMTFDTFDTSEPVKLSVELGKGTVAVTAAETTTTEVTVTGDDADAVRVTQEGDEIRIVDPKRSMMRGWSSPSYAVAVTLPLRSQLRVKTGSADVTTRGLLRAVWLQTGSGDIRLDVVDGPATVASGSGDVTVDRVGGELQIKTGSGDVTVAATGDRVSAATGSGDVRIDHATGDVSAKTGSGDLLVDVAEGDVSLTTGSGDLTVRRAVRGTVSGKGASSDIRVGIPAGTPVWTDVNTVSGSIRSSVPATGEPVDGQPYVELRARTVSGDIVLEAV
jgi:DUF4097 and DUF4098 domain-containing protein YvlB